MQFRDTVGTSPTIMDAHSTGVRDILVIILKCCLYRYSHRISRALNGGFLYLTGAMRSWHRTFCQLETLLERHPFPQARLPHESKYFQRDSKPYLIANNPCRFSFRIPTIAEPLQTIVCHSTWAARDFFHRQKHYSSISSKCRLLKANNPVCFSFCMPAIGSLCWRGTV